MTQREVMTGAEIKGQALTRDVVQSRHAPHDLCSMCLFKLAGGINNARQ